MTQCTTQRLLFHDHASREVTAAFALSHVPPHDEQAKRIKKSQRWIAHGNLENSLWYCIIFRFLPRGKNVIAIQILQFESRPTMFHHFSSFNPV